MAETIIQINVTKGNQVKGRVATVEATVKQTERPEKKLTEREFSVSFSSFLLSLSLFLSNI